MKKRASGLLLLTAMAAIGAAGIAACRTGREARRPELDQAMRRDPAPAATPQAQPETTPVPEAKTEEARHAAPIEVPGAREKSADVPAALASLGYVQGGVAGGLAGGVAVPRRADDHALELERSGAPFHTEGYDRIQDNPFLAASQNPLSTFSIDVDTASYANVRRFLAQGQRPPKDAVRIEELLNYFRYD